MNYLVLLFISALAMAEGKSSFFPVLSGGMVLEETLLDKSIERNTERKDDLYRIVVNYWNVSPIQYSVSFPILMVSQFAFCSGMSKMVLSVNNQYEERYNEARFKCVDAPPGYDEKKVRSVLALRYCTDINSLALANACKQAGLK